MLSKSVTKYLIAHEKLSQARDVRDHGSRQSRRTSYLSIYSDPHPIPIHLWLQRAQQEVVCSYQVREWILDPYIFFDFRSFYCDSGMFQSVFIGPMS